MKIVTSKRDPELIQTLQSGGVAVLRTDTIYGLVAQASNQRAVKRVYDIKTRDDHKPPIVLIATQAMILSIPTVAQQARLDTLWPGKVSVILPADNAPDWLTRGSGTVAYRLPDDSMLRELLLATGPLIAPSANLQGEPPAVDIAMATGYFGEHVDIYVNEGWVTDVTPSQLIRLAANGEMERLR